MKKWIPTLLLMALVATACAPKVQTPEGGQVAPPPSSTEAAQPAQPQANLEEIVAKVTKTLRDASGVLKAGASIPGIPADKLTELSTKCEDTAKMFEDKDKEVIEKINSLSSLLDKIKKASGDNDAIGKILNPIEKEIEKFVPQLEMANGITTPPPPNTPTATPDPAAEKAAAADALKAQAPATPVATPDPAAEKAAAADALKAQADNATKDNSSTVTSPTGLKYTIVQKGNGAEAINGKAVVVHYTGTLADGKKFDSSLDRGTPFEFTLGSGQVIPGWEEGIKGMKVGEKRKLEIPAKLGYGDKGAGDVIPPNSTLFFEVDLINVK